MLAESWKIIKNAEGNALPALPATGAASGVERFIVNNNSVSTPGNGSYGSKKYLGAGTTLVLAADHDRLLAERDGEIVELKQKLADEERRGDLHADLNKRVAEAVGNPFSGPGSSWHDLPEKVAALRTRAEAAEAKCAELDRLRDEVTRALPDAEWMAQRCDKLSRWVVQAYDGAEWTCGTLPLLQILQMLKQLAKPSAEVGE